ncbi:hypothetical protein CH256_15115 [Rhodococcus sp. 05-2254-6]|uniref:hypothetical protein n=1 Tax=Rhodococcus sp. 05-2254-6 TaxID=2022489 RepID=UPI000B9B3F48|nr:hypothetical protein [Rhodococcus sp. 05-2254-6]OZE30215.1 hypothetical protein CH256_15115 [Rhodococcus sp. 05-2254-6]
MGLDSNQLYASMQYWRNMSAQAEAGQLEIPEGVAAQCDAACVKYIDHLEDMIDGLQYVIDVGSFGDFDSSKKLGEKFERITYSGDRSLRVVLGQHIEVIQLMRSVFRRYFVATEEVDRSVGARIGDIGAGLGG